MWQFFIFLNKLSKIHSLEFIQTYADLHKLVQMYTNLSRFVETCVDLCKFMQIRTESHRLEQNCVDNNISCTHTHTHNSGCSPI